MAVSIGNPEPTCRCGAKMVLRNGKYGKFYGCSTFPRCKQTQPYKANGNGNGKPEPRKELSWSKFQLAIFALADNLDSWQHLVIKAGAGSGKTTVGVEFAARLPEGLDVAFVAFNVKIARTFAAKLPPHVHSSTLHSLGLGNVKNALGNVKVEGRKVWYIIKDLVDQMDWDRAEVVDQSISSIQKLVSLCKANLMEPTDENLDYIADRWNVETNGDREVIFETARETYRRSVEDTATIDFDDMIHLCATGRVPCKQFDVLVIDETQDLNKANLEFVVKSVKPGGHIVAVGDENQSIYGFRGADTDAMPNIIERLDAKVLPLSITYRCPKSHVELANTLVPELEAAPNAEDGILDSISEYQFLDMVKPGDLVLCRTNAPLVGPCFDLIRQGVKAVILGRDIGKGLMAMVKKIQKRYRVRALDETLEWLEEYRRQEIAKFIRAKKEMKAQILDDKVDTIFALSDGCGTVAELERKVERVFADDAEGVTFSTVHKSKGGEADRVFILKPELMPHPKAGKGWEMTQEWNIAYVAYTRAKKALYFVGGQPPFTTREPEPTPEPEPEPQKDADKEWDLLEQFPTEGRFESNIYRPSAPELAAAMPDWGRELDGTQLVMVKDLAPGHKVRCYTSIHVGQIAQGVGEDSIRVVREDQSRDGRSWYYKNPQSWVTRQVPGDITTPEAATAHLVSKIEDQIAKMTRNCPECGKLQVQCRAGNGRDSRLWWKGTDGCQCKVEGGW